MKRILYLHQYFCFPDEPGGTRSYDLATSFVKQGLKVTVITSSSDEKYKKGKRWTKVERDGLELHYIYLPYSNKFSNIKRIGVFLRFVWLSTLKLLSLKGDFVLATSTPLTIGLPALFKKWLHRTPFVFEVRDVWPEAVIAIGAIKNKIVQKGLYLLERIIYKNATAIVPLSVDMQSSIVTRYPKEKEKTEIVIENIAEVSRFNRAREFVDLEATIGFKPRFSVLYAGTFGRVNGVDYVVDLAKYTLTLDPTLVYLLMGDGALKESVVAKTREFGVLDRNVFFLPVVSKDQLPLWYRSVSMGSSFVIEIKELWANSANKFFDTLAAKKPMLINYEGWQADVIRDENIGYVLPPVLCENDAINFVEYTKRNELITEQGGRAYEMAVNRYSLERAIEKYLNVFNQIK
ncbi:hypothetical protein IX332_000747 [Porphyromonas levii]|uniref:glycosyltransferase family 4 protein n=1 Tax=Porphyromonas levii TaxID=28114 RepID=UPI001B8B502D|nr:glycosyltransferase family 4 protein [Porphyromonas levii]MBR8729427.1 hypothetical protein [Porphyromonas levii]